MKLERHLEDDCCARVEALGGRHLKIVTPGRRGRNDRLFILPGPRYIFVEFKREKGGRTAALQEREHRALRQLGCECYVCRTHEEFEKVLNNK